MAEKPEQEVEIGRYGARYLRLRDEFGVTGTGGVMGLSFWDTTVDNNLVGPQVSANWTHRRQRVKLDGAGASSSATTFRTSTRTYSLGQDLIPGQYNRGSVFCADVTDHGKQENFFSPTAELRAKPVTS